MKQRKQILIMYARNMALFINEYINANKWLQHTQRIEMNIKNVCRLLIISCLWRFCVKS